MRTRHLILAAMAAAGLALAGCASTSGGGGGMPSPPSGGGSPGGGGGGLPSPSGGGGMPGGSSGGGSSGMPGGSSGMPGGSSGMPGGSSGMPGGSSGMPGGSSGLPGGSSGMPGDEGSQSSVPGLPGESGDSNGDSSNGSSDGGGSNGDSKGGKGKPGSNTPEGPGGPGSGAQTSEERRQSGDKALDDSLGDFDKTLKKEQERVAKERYARGSFLIVAGVKDDRPILPSAVRSLVVKLCRVVRNRKENEQKLLVRDLVRVEFDHDRFGVVGPAAAYRFVVGGLFGAARVARDDRVDAFDMLKHGFDAPKASAGENGRLLGGICAGCGR